MRIGLLAVSILVLCLIFQVGNSSAQDKKVTFTFEVDGKVVREKFKISFVRDDDWCLAKSSINSFSIPEGSLVDDAIQIRFVSKNYDLIFLVYGKDLDSKWVVGIKSRPFI